jgi:hypothetical protein
MSYSRWGQDGSSVYVFLNTNGYLECCGCGLHADPSKSLDEREFGFYTLRTSKMISHLHEHIKAGECVPEYCIDRLLKDKTENDAWIKKTMKQHGGSTLPK